MTVPAHLLLGTLGSGKTTTLLKLLETAPAGERWAVFINEFGNVSLDTALVEGRVARGPAVFLEERHSGCICCSAQGDFRELLPQLLHRARPDRLLIEPTGLADAGALVTTLREDGADLGFRLESVIGHVDGRRFRDPSVMQLPFWQGLWSVSDHLLATKVDHTRPEQLAGFLALDKSENGPYLHIDRDRLAGSCWQQGRSRTLVTRFFSLVGNDEPGLSTAFHDNNQTHTEQTVVFDGRGRRLHSRIGKLSAVGWILSSEVVFPFSEFHTWVADVVARKNPPLRLKGILHTDKGVLGVQYVPGDPPEFAASRYRKDSRLEILLSDGEPVWESFESLKLHDPVGAPIDDLHQPA